MSHPALTDAVAQGLPDLPGIYRFWSDSGSLLYVGKSIHLRQRVASHFSAVGRDHREAKLCLATTRIDWQVTAGELGALLLESHLVKTEHPLFNRRLRRLRQLFTLQQDNDGQVQPVALREISAQAQFGLFRTLHEGREVLQSLVKAHALCPQRLGLSSGRPGQPCFQHQLGHCRGVCVGKEPAAAHDQRLQAALAEHRLQQWPWPGAVILSEVADHAEEHHVLAQWRWLGTASCLDAAKALATGRSPERLADGQLDRDIYYILRRQLQRAVNGECHLQVVSVSA